MDSIDYYKTLGLTKKASKAEIKAAYRKLARKYHPDKNPENKDAELSFQKINEANNVLSDPVKRKKYDQYGKDWQHADEFVNSRQQSSSNSRYSQGRSGSSSGDDFSEFFGSMFGGAGNNRNRQQVKFKGEDYSSELHVTLIDAYTTHQQTLNVNGKAIRITVPAGIKNGQTIKIKGHGGHGINGGPKGDLYLSFSIADHEVFKRLKNDLLVSTELNLYTAVLGGELTIDTMDGKVKLKVKPGTQNGKKVKLKGKGFPVYKKENHFGDLFVTYHVKIPTNLTEKQKSLFTDLSTL